MSATVPTLWQIDISHYSEKARWALDYKGVAWRRRAPVPGTHIPVALYLTRGAQMTFPVLRIEGETIGDSTAVIAALEERHPDPPLYPADPALRRRALELEDYFDEELGPAIRLFFFHEMREDPERFAALIERSSPPPLNRAPRLAAAYANAFTGLRFGSRSGSRAAQARERTVAAFDRLEEELGGGEYLVGDRFTVADLTAAALFYPLVQPEGGPLPADEPPPKGIRSLREELAGRRPFEWVAEMFRRHRRPSRREPAAAEDPLRE